ncbi:uncharacterized protein LOC122849369 [Aphidius gifuensis]|uniref:uncharacterized protein LOC122849369 n=1 Tax=Aphidius gifuensis TaxID=684658 RepID=UPI001CDD5628|nr:uncharacterized protein LOC122849369 [Aphidius gifuensis]
MADETDNKIGIISYTCNSIGLQKSWWLHWHLTKATEIINQTWSIQLFLWFGKLFSTILVKTYSISYQIQSNWRYAFYDAVIAISSLLQLYIIVIFCHITSNQANKVAQKILTSMKIQNKKERNLQNKDLANAYFCTRKIRFTAAHGLIHIHLPLLISVSIISAITTYLVILCKTP